MKATLNLLALLVVQLEVESEFFGVGDLAAAFVQRSSHGRAALNLLRAKGDIACKCKGFGPLPDLKIANHDVEGHIGLPLWVHMQNLDEFAVAPSHITYLGGVRRLLDGDEGGVLAYVLAHMQEAIVDCPPGVATIILLSLAVLEETFGLPFVQRYFALAMALVWYSMQNQPACSLKFSVMDASFVGNRFAPNFLRVPFLSGIDTGHREVIACSTDAPRIYVYEDESSSWTSPILDCANGLAATELWIHRQLLESSCRVDKPENAELIYVPIYGRCLYARKHGLFESGYSWDHPFTNASSWFAELLPSLPLFAARPADHVFMFPEERWPVEDAFTADGGVLADSIFLASEAHPISCDASDSSELPCHHLPERLGTVVVPSFIDHWQTMKLRKANRPINERRFLATFRGLGVDKPYAMTENFRNLLAPLSKDPLCSVGGYTPHYVEIMGYSIFCLIPKGVGTWSHRLYEAILAGCIPVILSDDMQLPFPELPWHTFSIKWPMRKLENPEVLASYLRNVSSRYIVESMKANVDANACWFDYHIDYADPKSSCSALVGITRGLRSKLQQRHGDTSHSRGADLRAHWKYWGVPAELL